MKSKVLQRKMFRDPSEDENVGIMQGFMDPDEYTAWRHALG